MGASIPREKTPPPARAGVLPAAACLLFAAGCSGGASEIAGPGAVATIPLAGGSALVFHDGGALATHRVAIETVVKETVAAVRPLLPFDGATIRVEAGGRLVIPELGIGGRADTGTIRIAVDPASPVLADSLETELFPLLAHEMHHVARFRAIGFADTLFEAMIDEGLADHFSLEVAGGEPAIWAVALTGARLDEWLEASREEWLSTSYDHGAWFFGTGPPIPRWAGYAVGFELVRRFLATSPSRPPSALYAEPASSFLPVEP